MDEDVKKFAALFSSTVEDGNNEMTSFSDPSELEFESRTANNGVRSVLDSLEIAAPVPPTAEPMDFAEALQNFDPQSPPPSSDLLGLQLWLECESQRESVLRYEKTINDARERGDYSSLTTVQRQLLNWYEPLKEKIESEQRAYLLADKVKRKKDFNSYGPYLCTLQAEKLAVILAHEAVMCALTNSGDAKLLNMALSIGAAVEAEVNVQRFLRKRAEEGGKRGRRKEETAEGAILTVEENRKDVPMEVEDQDEAEAREEAEEAEEAIDRWMYGASHLQKFIDEANRFEPGSKARLRISSANRRARRLLDESREWSKPHKIKLGIALIQMLLDTANIDMRDGHGDEAAFTYEKRWMAHNKSVGYVVLHDAFCKMVVEDKFQSWSPTTSRHQPMVVTPRDWVGVNDGAYCALRADLMRTNGCDTQKEALRDADLDTLFDGLNVLGRVPWVINKSILAAAQRCWDENISLGDIPSQTDFVVPPQPLQPQRPQDLGYDDKESEGYKLAAAEYRAYREAMTRHRKAHQKNMDLRSLRCSAILKLNQAEKFKDFTEIYFPYNVDFRGRAYPVPPHLSNVGSDLCRGMLTFASSKPLGPRGLYWLKVHLANLAGADKMSFDDRARFTDRNMDNIRDSVADPFGPNRWWMEQDEPFQCLATCHEIVNAIDSGDPETYWCSLPVHMDGSCNGLQHYAALGRDTLGGKAVNLCPGSDKPEDVYIGVMHEVVNRVAEEAAKDLDFDHGDSTNVEDLTKEEKQALKHNRAAKLVNGLIDRGVVKRTVMTSVYGVTYIGARKQIQEKIEEKLEDKGIDIDEIDHEIHSACSFLASVTMEVMGELFTGARQTMNWLTSCARLIASQGQPVAWISPLGVPIVQPYRQHKAYSVVTLLQTIVLADNSDDLPIHKQRQVSAFPPNYVHSLDSSHMLLTSIEMERRGLTFSAVHDSFWTHPCDVDEMNEVLRESFVELYDQPLLESLKRTWELRYPSLEFPEIPERGDMDLDDVKEAPYFFQ